MSEPISITCIFIWQSVGYFYKKHFLRPREHQHCIDMVKKILVLSVFLLLVSLISKLAEIAYVTGWDPGFAGSLPLFYQLALFNFSPDKKARPPPYGFIQIFKNQPKTATYTLNLTCNKLRQRSFSSETRRIRSVQLQKQTVQEDSGQTMLHQLSRLYIS